MVLDLLDLELQKVAMKVLENGPKSSAESVPSC